MIRLLEQIVPDTSTLTPLQQGSTSCVLLHRRYLLAQHTKRIGAWNTQNQQSRLLHEGYMEALRTLCSGDESARAARYQNELEEETARIAQYRGELARLIDEFNAYVAAHPNVTADCTQCLGILTGTTSAT